MQQRRKTREVKIDEGTKKIIKEKFISEREQKIVEIKAKTILTSYL